MRVTHPCCHRTSDPLPYMWCTYIHACLALQYTSRANREVYELARTLVRDRANRMASSRWTFPDDSELSGLVGAGFPF